jgi:hypothetical protein
MLNIFYIDVIRKLCNDGLPTSGYFELCALYLLEFEKLLKENKFRNKTIKQLINDDKQTEYRKIDKSKDKKVIKKKVIIYLIDKLEV